MSVLHVINGDAMRDGLERAGLEGEITVYADVLHEGPVPRGFDAESIAARSRFLAAAGYGSYDDVLALGLHWQAMLDRHADYDDVVLWFEHDLFDQLLLIRHLAFFDAQQRTSGVWLICSDQYLGPMSAEQLARMYETRTVVSAEQRALGVRAWSAFTTANALELLRVFAGDTNALPFLSRALLRFLEEYPSVINGLGRLDRQILGLLDAGEASVAELFAANARLEEAIFLGDTVFWKHVEQLARGATPLVELDTSDIVRITDAGRDVAAGRTDAVALNGIDRCLGGVHLQGEPRWRWDPDAFTLIEG